MSGRIRTVKPEWLEDELLAAASDEARVLSVALLLMADDHGRGRASVATIASTVWRFQMERDEGSGAPEILARASRALRELVEIRFVHLYEVDRQRYFAIRNWLKHQKVDKPSAPRVPPPKSLNISLAREHVASGSRGSREGLATDHEEEEDLRSPISDHTESASGLELVLGGFQSGWQARYPGAWPGVGKHRARADELARNVETGSFKRGDLAASLAGYFSNNEPFLVKVRHNFACWANDPERWISARTDPTGPGLAILAAGIPDAGDLPGRDQMTA